MSNRHHQRNARPRHQTTAPARLILTLTISLALTSGCVSWRNGFDKPRIDLAGFEPIASSNGGPQFAITLRVINPNTTALNIKGLYYEISVEGHEIVTGTTNKSSVIPAYGEGVIILHAAPSLLGTIGLARKLISQGAEKTAFDYQLYTKISLAGQLTPMRIRHQGTLELNSAKLPRSR